MKYDGISGYALWPAPATFHNPGSTFHGPVALGVDARGDVLATAVVVNGGNDWATLKFDGLTGAILWGPSIFDGAAHGNDSPVALALDGAGNVVVAGTADNGSGDFETVKYSGATGAQIWSRAFSGPVVGNDSAVALAVDRAGNVVVSGNTPGTAAFTTDWATLKYDGATGATLWGPVLFNGTANLSDRVSALTLDATGNVFVTGTSSNGSNTAFATLKYDGATGATLWGPALFNGPGNLADAPVALAVDGAGNLFVTGQSVNGNADFATLKYDGTTGAVLWGPAIFDGGTDVPIPNGLVVVGSGDVLVTGTSPSGALAGLATLKYSGSTGSTIWGPVHFTGGGTVALLSANPMLATDASGNVVVTGSGGSGTSTIKLAAQTGAILWGPVSLAGASPAGVATDGSGDVYVVCWKSNGTDVDTLVFKYSGATGAALWGPTTIDRGAGLSEYGLALNVDPAGNVIVSGTTGPSVSVFSVKCSGATGAILWGPALYPAGLNLGVLFLPQFFYQALDGAGNVAILTEQFSGPGPFETPDFVTLKVNGATGTLAWGPNVYDSPASGVDLPSALAFDGAGNVFVAGTSGTNVALLKYSGAAGATLWGPVLQPAGSSPSLPAIAVDGSGNVFLSGTSGSGSAADVVTLKYAGTTGAVLWGPVVYDSTGSDQARAVAVDTSGDVVVAGSVSNASTLGLFLLKYAGSDGSPVWGPVLTDFSGDSRVVAMRLVGDDPVLVTGYLNGAFAARYTLSLAIQNPPGEIASVSCGRAFSVPLTARNGTPPYTWTLVSGGPPPGIALDPSGMISGASIAEGTWAFRARVTDNVGAFRERDFTLTVADGSSHPAVTATVNPLCAGGGTTLSVAGIYSSYLWLPGGETGPSVTVSPAHPTTYGVVVTEASGCLRRGSLGVGVAPIPAAPVISTPGTAGAGSLNRQAAIATATGGSTYAWSITNGTITSGQGTARITFTAGSPGSLTLQAVETSGAGCTSPAGSASVTVVGAQSALLYYTLPPCRILDTRNPNGPLGGPALAASAPRTFTVAGACGIPATAKSISANLTVTQPAATGNLIAYPSDQVQPLANTLSFRTGQTRANNSILLLAIDGSGGVAFQNASAGTVHLILDVNGYFQ